MDQLLPIAPAFVWTNCSQLLPRERFGAIRLDQLLPFAPAGAIGSNSFGPIAPNCSRGSNSEQFVWTNCSQLLPRERFGAIRLDQLLPIAPAGAIGSNSFGPIAINYSCGSDWEQFVWNNCSQLLLRERIEAIRLDQLLPIAPAGAIGSNSFGPTAPNCSSGSDSEQFV